MRKSIVAVWFMVVSSSVLAQSSKIAPSLNPPENQLCGAVSSRLNTLEIQAGISTAAEMFSSGAEQLYELAKLQTIIAEYQTNLQLLVAAKCTLPKFPFNSFAFAPAAQKCTYAKKQKQPGDNSIPQECNPATWQRSQLN